MSLPQLVVGQICYRVLVSLRTLAGQYHLQLSLFTVRVFHDDEPVYGLFRPLFRPTSSQLSAGS